MHIKNKYIQYMYSYPHKTAYGPLEGVDLKSYFNHLKGQENSLYFHVPFCQYKCGYCNLFSLAGQSEEMMEEYVSAMERQASQIRDALPNGVEFADLTLGGGTPLILPEHLLERVFQMARGYFGFQPKGRQIVVETSPNQTTDSKLKLLKEQGVTRLSIGVQSFQEKELQAIARLHSVESAKKALQSIKKADFDCVNIDLIYGIPGQTKESLLDSLEQALAFEPEELFVYPLYVKPGTGLYERMQSAKINCASEPPVSACEQGVSTSEQNVAISEQGVAISGQNVDISEQGVSISEQNDDMYLQAQLSDDTYILYQCVRETLVAKGYHPYSMRRFVKMKNNTQDNEQKQTNEPKISLCGFGNTLSIGCGGRSYLGNLHFCTPYAVKQSHCMEVVKEYIEKTDYLKVDLGYLLNEEEQRRRYVMKHILFDTGIYLPDYRMHFKSEPEQDYKVIAEWMQNGYAVKNEEFIALTEEGFALSDYLGPQLISEEVRCKMKQWSE